MRSKPIKIILLLALAVAVAIVGKFIYDDRAATGGRENIAASELKAGDTAPDFSAKLLSGDAFTLSDHRGRVVFLNFWASWCSPCVAEMPAVQQLSKKYADSVVFIGMNYAENEGKVQDFISERGFTYSIGLDEAGDIAKNLYPSDGIPYTLIIDAEGVISDIFLGGGDKMYNVFDAAITKALNR